MDRFEHAYIGDTAGIQRGYILFDKIWYFFDLTPNWLALGGGMSAVWCDVTFQKSYQFFFSQKVHPIFFHGTWKTRVKYKLPVSKCYSKQTMFNFSKEDQSLKCRVVQKKRLGTMISKCHVKQLNMRGSGVRAIQSQMWGLVWMFDGYERGYKGYLYLIIIIFLARSTRKYYKKINIRKVPITLTSRTILVPVLLFQTTRMFDGVFFFINTVHI